MVDRSRLIDLGWVLCTNLLVLAGVIAWGWPPGNVFVLFWIENVILGVVTTVRIATAQGRADGAPRWARSAFFVAHYGIFAIVHGAFALFIAFSVGFAPTLEALGLPAILIALRYVVELATGWFRGGRRKTVTPDQAFAWPYPRLIVLHVATLLGFAAVMSSGRTTGVVAQALGPLLNWLERTGLQITDGVLVVALLIVLKTVADLAVLSGRPGTGSLRFSLRNGS